MNIDLKTIQEMWEQDSKIDIDNLHNESINIPVLHSKYHNLYSLTGLVIEKLKTEYNQIKLEQYNYYTGKAPAEIYVENPFPYKVRDKDAILKHMEADEKVNTALMKVKYHEYIFKFLESVLKQISERNWQIRNSIEFQKFCAGLS